MHGVHEIRNSWFSIHDVFCSIESGPLSENNIHIDKVDDAVQQLPLSSTVGVDATHSQGNIIF